MKGGEMVAVTVEKKYMKTKELAEIYSLSPRKIRMWCLLGKIPGAVKIKGTKEWRIPVDAFDRFVKSGGW